MNSHDVAVLRLLEVLRFLLGTLLSSIPAAIIVLMLSSDLLHRDFAVDRIIALVDMSEVTCTDELPDRQFGKQVTHNQPFAAIKSSAAGRLPERSLAPEMLDDQKLSSFT